MTASKSSDSGVGDWTLIVVASRYRWPEAPPVWREPKFNGQWGDAGVTSYPLVKKDEASRTAWYGAVLV